MCPHVPANPARDVTGPILDLLSRPRDDGRIATSMISGTRGKPTTSSMPLGVLAAAGHAVGHVTTVGVSVGGELVAAGYYAGANGAEIVLRDPTVTAVALETARGSLLKSGIVRDRCDVAALLILGREQTGMDGVGSVEEMAALKRKVLDAAITPVVLNANDPHCTALVPDFGVLLRTLLFSRDSDCALGAPHRSAGGEFLYLAGPSAERVIMLAHGDEIQIRGCTLELALMIGGIIWQSAVNAMAAAGLALGLGIAPETIADGGRRYGAADKFAPRRFAFGEGFPLRIMVDFAAHAPALAAAVTVTDRMVVVGQWFCAATLPGDRPDWQVRRVRRRACRSFRRICLLRVQLSPPRLRTGRDRNSARRSFHRCGRGPRPRADRKDVSRRSGYPCARIGRGGFRGRVRRSAR
jgi:cyanophycin synthetase